MRNEVSMTVANSPQAPLRSSVAMIDPRVEYWSQRKPYTSNGRTFGRIELVSALYQESTPSLFVRGWIFDQQGPLSALTLFARNNQPGTTVSQLVREDVALPFISFPQARLSGFVSLLPTQDIPGKVCLQGAYRHGDTIINFAFDEHPVSLGIAAPGATIETPPASTPDATGGVALIVTPGWEPPEELVEVFKSDAHELCSRLWIFSNQAPLDSAEALSISDSVLTAPLDSVASMLWGRTHLLRRIVVVGRLDAHFMNRQILPLIAASPTPRIVWLLEEEPPAPLATLIRGEQFDSYRLKTLTPDQLRRIIR
jgi:hypothetical protein